MKILLLITLFITFFLGNSNFENENYQNEVCLRAFTTLLKDGNQKTVWTLVLNKGTFYRFRLFEQEGEGEYLYSFEINKYNLIIRNYAPYKWSDEDNLRRRLADVLPDLL